VVVTPTASRVYAAGSLNEGRGIAPLHTRWVSKTLPLGPTTSTERMFTLYLAIYKRLAGPYFSQHRELNRAPGRG